MKNKVVLAVSFLIVVAIVIIICLLPNSFVSSTNASYKTTISGEDYARVAKWNIISVSDDGESIEMLFDFTRQLNSGDEGYCYLEMRNYSEVLAKLDSSTSLDVVLKHQTFAGLQTNITWDFLDGDNPVNFDVYFISSNDNDWKEYKLKNSTTTITPDLYDGLTKNGKNDYTLIAVKAYRHNLDNTIINEEQYNLLNAENKANYSEITTNGYKHTTTGLIISETDYNALDNIGKSSYDLVVKTTHQDVHRIWGTSDSPSAIYVEQPSQGEIEYKTTIPFNTQLESLNQDDLIMNMGGGIPKIFVLHWKVDDVSSSSTTSGVTKKYKAYSLVETNNMTGYTKVSGTNNYTVDGKTYNIAYQEKDYFQYLNTFGKEPAFIFPSGISGVTKKITYSKLSQDNINTINSYTIPSATSDTFDILNKYIEKLTYNEFKSYRTDVEVYEKQQGYIGYGFTVGVKLSARVSQVD